MIKISYKGNRTIAIPNIGEFKPNEPIDIPPSIAEVLLENEHLGFERVNEHTSKKKKTVDRDVEITDNLGGSDDV